MWINFSNLVLQRVPDRTGNFLPTDLSSVTYDLKDLTPGGHSLIANDLAVNTALGQAIPACPYCCGYALSSLGFDPDPVDVIIDGLETVGITGLNSCNGIQSFVTVDFTSWSSSNTNIANVTTAQVQGVGVGTATGFAQGIVNGPGQCACSPRIENISAPITVNPRVSFTGGNNFIFEGTDPTVILFNQEQVQGTPSQGTFSWSATSTSSYHPNISFNSAAPPYTTSSDLVTVTGNAPSSSLLDTTLSVGYTANYPSAPTPATRAITIRIFRFLQQAGNLVVVQINGTIIGGVAKYGYTSTVFYNVLTNPQGQVLPTGLSNISVIESVSLTAENFPVSLIQSTGGTNSQSQVQDTLAIVGNSPLPVSFSSTADQYLSVGGFLVRHNTLTYSASGPTITRLGPFN